MNKAWLFVIANLDPRYGQLLVLFGLLGYGTFSLNFNFPPWYPPVMLTTALVCQYLCSKYFKSARFEWRSALITALSLVLLLRTDSIVWAMSAAAIAISSKFILRWRQKALFNPSNLALTVAMVASPRCWLSPGQWGTPVILIGFVGLMAWMILTRVERWDITLAFLSFYGLGLLGRAVWLGDPWTIPFHQLMQGSLFIYAFFMITDPKTTPDHRQGRLILALVLAGATLYGRFGFYQPNALIYSLTLCSPLIPWFDRRFPAKSYRWNNQ